VPRAFPLLALALLAAGCGKAYSAAEVQRALGTSATATVQYYVDPSRTVFATSAAVTDLVIEETPALPPGIYQDNGLYAERYRESHEAWLAAHSPSPRRLTLLLLPGQHEISRVDANVVLMGESGRVNAAIARLH
jgi:hypothetical protein